MQALETASRSGTPDADAWAELAAAYLRGDKAEEARAAAKHAVEADPDNPRANAVLALIAYSVDKDATRAEMLFRKVKKADERLFVARLYLGIIAMEDDRNKVAIREFEAARKLYPRFHTDEKSPYTALVDLYEETNRPRKAIGVLRDLLAVDHGLSQAHQRLGELLLDEDEPAEAAAAFMQAIYINPYLPEIHDLAAEAFSSAGNDEAAAREREVAEALARPGSP